MNGIKSAGFGLGLVVTALGLTGLSVLVPVPGQQPPQAVLSPVTAAPDTTGQEQEFSPPQAPVSDPAPAISVTDPVPMPSPDARPAPLPTPQLADQDAPVIQSPNAQPPTPVIVPLDTASLPAIQAQVADDPGLALTQTAPVRPAPITQPPFRAPSSAGGDLPNAPDLPLPAAVAPPQTEPDLPAPGVPEAETPEPETPEPAPAEPAAPEPAAPESASPEPTAPVGLPGRPVAGMPGQAVSRPSAGEPAAQLPTAQLPALARNAADLAPDAGLGQPLMAIVLNDPGLPEAARMALATRATPFSVVLNPMDPTASAAAALYRSMGKEVFLLAAGLPDGATAADVDVTLSAYFAALPEAAGLIDLPRDGAVRNARLLADVLQVVARDGHGLITFAGGLGQADRAAAAAGVAHAEVFRVLDANDESPFTIRRFLDRAVFQASQLGQVIVFGEASSDAVLQALDLWQTEGQADQVDLVPASAILLGGLGRPQGLAE